MNLYRIAFLLPLAGAMLFCGGCSLLARRMASENPGDVPRAGQVFRVAAVAGEQVCITFSFKAGPDPVVPQSPASAPQDDAVGSPDGAGDTMPSRSPAPAGPAVRVVEARFVDTTGRRIDVIDFDVRRDGNVCYVSFTSAAAPPDSYEIICQARLTVGAYQVTLAAAVTREPDCWRVEERSFKFAVSSGAAGGQLWHFNILRRL